MVPVRIEAGQAGGQAKKGSPPTQHVDASGGRAYHQEGTTQGVERGENLMPRSITLTLDEGLIEKARVLAARRNRSVAALLREALSRLVAEDEAVTAYESAKRTALKRLERGTHLGGGLLPTRDELHDRAGLR
jgi:plasmid stability protein